jgi:hypothetical protein
MSASQLVIARLYEYLEPIDRGERYEDPLHDALTAAGLGRVTGGGSQLNASGGIEFVDLEIELVNLDDALATTVSALETAGAPAGSEILHDGAVLREFGTTQCLAIFLDGVSLPDDVYANLDFADVVTQLGDAAGPGSYRCFWQGSEETGLFFFGSDAEEMFRRVEPVLSTLPIGENARVVIRYGKPAFQPRTVQMPRR